MEAGRHDSGPTGQPPHKQVSTGNIPSHPTESSPAPADTFTWLTLWRAIILLSIVIMTVIFLLRYQPGMVLVVVTAMLGPILTERFGQKVLRTPASESG
jgi:hypothetical protein